MRAFVVSRLKIHSSRNISSSLKSYPKMNGFKPIVRSLYTWSRHKGLLRHTKLNAGINTYQKRFKEQPQQSSITFWNPSKKNVPHKGTLLEEISDGFEIIKRDIPVFKEEMKSKLQGIECYDMEHNSFEYFEEFNRQERVSQWIVSADSDTDQGKSTAAFKYTDRNTAIFHGNISKEVPADGYSVRAGYCAISAPFNKKSFERVISYNWEWFSHLLLKVRGDGRIYSVILQTNNYFDLHQLDIYAYPLYTHGGPYWQIIKIPFAHFFLTNKGRIQTAQEFLPIDRIKTMSIVAADYEGPYQLEIDYIALLYDETTDDKIDFRYEMYEKPGWIL